MSNTLNGEAGNDTFTQQAAFAVDVINGGTGTDTVSYAVRTTAILVTIDAVADDGDTAANAGAGEDDTVAVDVENVTGGAGNDTINALADVDAHMFIGNAGNDTLIGSDGGDTLTGGAGDDILMGRLGADTINGDAGSDTISFNHADHTAGGVTVDLSTTPGMATTGDVFNTVMGSPDVENVKGSPGADTITGSTGANTIWGGAGVDSVSGGDGDDSVHGEDGADTLVSGGNGDDVVSGGEGDDVSVQGGADNDLVDVWDSVAVADNTVDCGTGNDILVDDSLDAGAVGCELNP